MKKSLKNPVLFVVMAFSVIMAVLPIIIFASLNMWPIPPMSLPLIVLYWFTTAASLGIGIVWSILQFKGGKETSILYLQLICTVAVQFLPLINWLFFLAPLEWIFIIPLILDVIIYLGYALIIVLSSRLANKAVETLEKVKAEEKPIVDEEKTFNNEDGTFKGSRVKVNVKKKD